MQTQSWVRRKTEPEGCSALATKKIPSIFLLEAMLTHPSLLAASSSKKQQVTLSAEREEPRPTWCKDDQCGSESGRDIICARGAVLSSDQRSSLVQQPEVDSYKKGRPEQARLTLLLTLAQLPPIFSSGTS